MGRLYNGPRMERSCAAQDRTPPNVFSRSVLSMRQARFNLYVSRSRLVLQLAPGVLAKRRWKADEDVAVEVRVKVRSHVYTAYRRHLVQHPDGRERGSPRKCFRLIKVFSLAVDWSTYAGAPYALELCSIRMEQQHMVLELLHTFVRFWRFIYFTHESP